MSQEPVQVKAWACAFKCGYAVKTKRRAMLEHQERCFRNPARRACVTCKHFVRAVHNPDCDDPPYCNVNAQDDLFSRLYADCTAWEIDT